MADRRSDGFFRRPVSETADSSGLWDGVPGRSLQNCGVFFPVSAEEVAQESVGDGRIEGGGYCEIHTCHTFESVLK